MTPKLTILTPTYNRAELLKICYRSLCTQTSTDFEWLIIDDGSTDCTQEVVCSLQGENQPFEIHYQQKENGGKHTALNYAHPYIRGELLLILDSDDTLTNNAVETILFYWRKHSSNSRVWCLSFQRGYDMSTPICDWDGVDEFISNHIEFRINRNIDGDCAEVVRSEIFKKYSFPVFPGECFFGEGYLWVNAAYEYDTAYIKQLIYICEYLEGGLTKGGRKMRMKNPMGGMFTSKMYLSRRFSLRTRVKKAILYDCYALMVGTPFNYIRNSGARLLCTALLPIGVFFYYKWKPKSKLQ